MLNIFRKIIQSLILILIFSVQGCSTLGVSYHSKSSQNSDTHEVIQYMAYPTYQGVRQKGVILVGQEFTYLISSGENELETLLRQSTLNSHVIILQPINIYRYPDNSIKINIQYKILKPNKANKDNESLEATNSNNKLCFSQNNHINMMKGRIIRGQTPTNSNMNSEHLSIINCQLEAQGGLYKAIDSYEENLDFNGGVSANILNIQDKRLTSSPENGVIPLKTINEALLLSTEILKLGKMVSGF